MTAGRALTMFAVSLPDPGNPFIAGWMSGLGMFVGWLAGVLRGLPDERARRWLVHGTAIGFGIGFASYVVAVAVDLL